MKIPKSVLHLASVPSVATDDGRIDIKNVHVSPSVAIATDGKILARVEYPVSDDGPGQTLLVRPEFFRLIKKTIGKKEENFRLSIEGSDIMVQTASARLSDTLPDVSSFPDTRAFRPDPDAPGTIHVLFDPARLLEAVKLLADIAEDVDVDIVTMTVPVPAPKDLPAEPIFFQMFSPEVSAMVALMPMV